MARRINRLTEIGIKALKEPGLHADGNGLYLRVTASGSRSWIFRYQSGGRLRDMGMGKYPTISLATAREQSSEAHTQIMRGDDPIETRREKIAATSQRNIVTFDEAAERYIAAHESSWRNEKHRQQWKNTLATYASPVLGRKSVAAINTDDVLRILEPIWAEKPETAGRVRGRIENVLDWCKVRKFRDGENPAAWRGNLNHLLPTHNKTRSVRHHPALAWREIPKFMTELRANGSLSARALELTILTALRTSECVGGTWSEIDIDEAVWTIPPHRMKRYNEHRVPLSAAAIAMLSALPRRPDSEWLFPGARPKRTLSNMAMLELLRGMRPGLTVHGFRSTFRDWASEFTSFPHEVVEMALAHAIANKVEAAYRRGDLMEKRQKLMEAWAEYCGPSC